MIASLRGTIIAQEGQSVVIDVSGVGYLVQVPNPAKYSLNQNTFIHTSTVVREDAFVLFGFENFEELQTFETLRTVSGVGPKSALAILAGMHIEQIAKAVANNDDAAFKAVSGIGPKTAKLICVTLAGKFSKSQDVLSRNYPSNVAAEVIDALVSLGWNEKIARDAVFQMTSESEVDSSSADLLKLALARLGRAKSIGATDE